MTRQVHSPDLQARELDGVLDFAMLKRIGGGLPHLDPVTEREFKTVAETEAFMNDLLVIEIHTSTDKNAPVVCEVGVNGDKVVIPRGRKVRIPRRFVERLAQSQATSFRQERHANPDADEGMVTKRSTAQEYPFSVLKDPSPKGSAWLARVIREGA